MFNQLSQELWCCTVGFGSGTMAIRQPNFMQSAFDFSKVTETDEQDTLYREIDIYIKGHENSVLESYSSFVKIAANELGIEIAGV